MTEEKKEVAPATAAAAVEPTASTGSTPKVAKGMLASIMPLYQSKKDDDGNRSWIKEMPEIDPPVENDETAQHALLVRKVKSYDGRKKFNIHSIVIQSPILRDVLGKVLDSYPGVKCNIEKLTFEPGFEPFVHRWSKLRKVLKESEGEAKEHLQLLHDVLEEDLRDTIATRDDFLANEVINFGSLWMLFEPGSVVFATRNGQPCAAKFTQGNYGSNQCGRFYGLSCQYVDWDGEKFGYASTNFQIRDFNGHVKISELSAMPLHYVPNSSATKDILVTRGKVWEALSGYHYMSYNGVAIEESPQGPMACNINSRIIIDTYGWNRFMPNNAVYVGALSTSNNDAESVVAHASDESSQSEPEDEDYYESEPEDNYINIVPDVLAPKGKSKPKPLIDDELLLTTPTLKGYSLKDKKWLTLFLDCVRPNTFSSNAFSSLVLDAAQKDLVLALTAAQRKHKALFDDVIGGKGRGMIMLLAGPPGVGKTLTAESVAEQLEVPLYVVGAGDLGTGYRVESNLRDILEMCERWQAVCLIDEADVFLEARNANDLERNKLVSVFLRVLEYYEGLLFLTTNRVDNIDAAFQSRIHLSLAYPDLTPESRGQVWERFIETATKAAGKRRVVKGHKGEVDATPVATPSFSEEDLERLAGFNMNGREIKNVLKTAQLLATMKEESLGFRHVKQVMDVEQRYQGKQ